jgi:protein-tyrosine phosphatase
VIAQLARRRRRALYRARTLLADARERGARPPQPAPVEPELRILFVCLGNTCRSPLAEGIMRQRLAEEGLLGRVVVDSAGVSGRTDGLKPDPRARRVARSHGLTLGSQRARTFEQADFDRFDRIVVFDRGILEAVTSAARSEADRSRVSPIRGEGEIADPVAGDYAVYVRTYDDIAAACEALLGEIRAELG